MNEGDEWRGRKNLQFFTPFFSKRKFLQPLFCRWMWNLLRHQRRWVVTANKIEKFTMFRKHMRYLENDIKWVYQCFLRRFWSSIKHSKGWKCLSIHAELRTRYRANEERSKAYVYLHNLSSASGLTRKEFHKSWEFVVYHKRMSKCFFSPCFTP